MHNESSEVVTAPHEGDETETLEIRHTDNGKASRQTENSYLIRQRNQQKQHNRTKNTKQTDTHWNSELLM